MELSLVGPTNRLASTTADPSRTLNWFYESTSPGVGAKARGTFRPVSGLTLFCQFGDNGNVALYEINGRVFGVCGTVFGELFEDGTVTEYGPVSDSAPYRATICSNGSAGNQLFITAGGFGYIFDLLTDTLTLIADPGFPANCYQGEFMDGYFIVLIKDSRRFQISALEDGTSWDPLDVAERSIAADNISFIKRNHRELFLIGNRTSEAWYDSGDPDFPFQPIQGVLIESGSQAPFSAARIDNAIVWVDQDERGGGVVRKLSGYTPEKISSYAIDYRIWQSISAELLHTAIGIAWQEQGHLFYGIQLNSAETMPVFDFTEGQWHERAIWDPLACVWKVDVFTTHVFAFNKHLVGDWRTGAIYELSPTAYADQVVSI